ncbi:hypothetical protein LV716_07375 [Flagellimonas sp. HMM57]|uniref:hypothetical protein n=1 Tax=unclassified Flagellimonas TaxID=2644544 RepID=UPI0013D18160|nr:MULTISPECIES: hypothetical protein [unclassified Flagellimonas]MBS9461245.1 hypothetical protein [Flagellimonas sp. 389]UII77580.1 hypothetical protein LV716_07375 [Flagellimonas sp. HMM57]
MDIYEYWIGRNVNYRDYWEAYDAGQGYKMKFESMTSHIIEIEFENPTIDLPLFNQEAIYKTLKGYYHDLKKYCLSESEYGSAGPLFLYEINRGSGIWTFLGELPYILLYGTTLTREKIIGQRLDNMEKKLKIMKEYFGNGIRPELYDSFMKAKSPREIESAVERLFQERIKDIRISEQPFNGNIEETRQTLISLNEKLDESVE